MNTKLSLILAALTATGAVATLTGSQTLSRPAPTTPCMVVLNRFTAGDVPAMGPAETYSLAGRWTNGITPPNLPGCGLAQHPMLCVGENYDKMFLINDGKVIWTYSTGTSYEYDRDFNEIWRYTIKSPWAAIRLKNGDTLITDEADSLTREVNSRGQTVWEFNTKPDLPPAYQFAAPPQTATRLANGNTIFTSRGNDAKGPQLIEVTPDKKVVWVLQDWKDFNGLTAVRVLDDPGIPETPGQSEH